MRSCWTSEPFIRGNCYAHSGGFSPAVSQPSTSPSTSSHRSPLRMNTTQAFRCPRTITNRRRDRPRSNRGARQPTAESDHLPAAGNRAVSLERPRLDDVTCSLRRAGPRREPTGPRRGAASTSQGHPRTIFKPAREPTGEEQLSRGLAGELDQALEHRRIRHGLARTQDVEFGVNLAHCPAFDVTAVKKVGLSVWRRWTTSANMNRLTACTSPRISSHLSGRVSGKATNAASTSQGHPYAIFRRALERDNLVIAEVTSQVVPQGFRLANSCHRGVAMRSRVCVQRGDAAAPLVTDTETPVEVRSA
jgi:hypothetical protein